MIEKGNAAYDRVRRVLFQNGYLIVARNGYPKFIVSADETVVSRMFPICSSAIKRSSGMLRATPETGPEAHLSGVGC